MNFTDDELRDWMSSATGPEKHSPITAGPEIVGELARQLLLARAALRAKHKVGDMILTVRAAQKVDGTIVQDERTIMDDLLLNAKMGDILWSELRAMRESVGRQVDSIVRGIR